MYSVTADRARRERVCATVRFAVVCVMLVLLPVTPAVAQLQGLYERVTLPGQVLSAEEGKQALRDLHDLNLAEALEGEAGRQVLGIRIRAALAVGDSRRAAKLLGEVQQAAPEQRTTLDLAYLVACAAGDAQLGEQTLRQLRKLADGDERRALAQRRRWVQRVGMPAPKIEVPTEDGTTVSLADRAGTVLLIDFWSVRFPPSDELRAALREVHETYGQDRKVEFLGVNTDSVAKVAEAQEYAAAAGYRGSQHYERGAPRDKSVRHAFGAGTPPWQIVIDQYGFVRAVGSATEPGFRYALRAAVGEAKRRYDPVLPRTRDGERALPPEELIRRTERKASDKPKASPGGPLPRNPEAGRKLALARTFYKTGRRTDAKRLFEEIVRGFPGTFEAKVAQEYLDSWP